VIRTFVAGGCALAALEMTLGAPRAFADEQPERTATVTGVLYDDQNLNGVRDAGEPGLPGLKVHGTKDIVTDAEGRYTITGVLHDSTEDVWLPVAATGGKLTLSKPKDATDVAWVSGWVYVEVSSDAVTTHDFGYGRWHVDQAVSANWSDSGTPQASSSEELVYTGVEPKPYLAAGVALLGVGVALVGAARRRPRLTEDNNS
jgi:hypothetical protein